MAPEQTAYVSFTSVIDDASCRTLLNSAAQLVTAGVVELHLLLSTGGGNVVAGFTIYNTLRALPLKLVSHNMGSVNSIGNVVFLAADERYACAHSTFMFHGVTWPTPMDQISRQQATERLESIMADEKRIGSVLGERTALTAERVDEFFKAAATLDAVASQTAGIVQAIAEPNIPKGAQLVVLT